MRKFPIKDPDIKLTPIIKLIGKSIVLLMRKFTLLLFELFWMAITNIKNKVELKKILKIIFLIGIAINACNIGYANAIYKFRLL